MDRSLQGLPVNTTFICIIFIFASQGRINLILQFLFSFLVHFSFLQNELLSFFFTKSGRWQLFHFYFVLGKEEQEQEWN